MRTLSLFSGIGGMDLGLERAGFKIVAQCEADPFCRSVLAKHWPGAPCWSDVTMLADALEPYARDGFEWQRPIPMPIDCVCGGFPCQDVSVAGKGLGVEAGERSGLWREMFRVIRALKPRWVIAENVPALRTRGADRVLGDLEEAGYAHWPIVVGAEHVGAPHRRHRVFIVAHLKGGGLGTDGRPQGQAGHADQCGEGVAQSDGSRWSPSNTGHPQHTGGQPVAGGGGLGDAQSGGAGPVPAGPGRQDQATCDAHGTGEGVEHAGGAGREEQHAPALAARAGLRDRQPARWPAGPGEPQHDWEAPRLVEFPLGVAVDGVPVQLVRAANRNALKGYGNAVVPQVAEVVGLAVMATDAELRKAVAV